MIDSTLRPASTPAPTPTKRSHSMRENPVARVAAMIVMVVFAVYFLIPLFWLLVTASKTPAQIATTPRLWFTPTVLTDLTANIGKLFAYNDGLFARWLLNSVLYAGVGAFVSTLISAMCGYALAKYTFRGREALFNVVLSGVLVPATALALPLFLIFSQIGLTNSFWSVFIPSIVSPFGVYLARIFAAAAVPNELLEAARLDGAGEVKTFFTLATRLMAPALVTIFLFQFVAIWNNFFLPLIMLRDQTLFPVTLGLFAWNSTISQNPELRAFVIVGSLISILPLIIAFLSLQRFWSSGLSEGSIK